MEAREAVGDRRSPSERPDRGSDAGGWALTPRRRVEVPLSTRLLGLLTMVFGRVVPPLGARLAYRLWFRTVRPSEDPAAIRVLRRSERRTFEVNGAPVAVYAWGRGPTVLLVHGWGSHAGRMTRFVEPLLDRGFGVVALDLPAHGRSAGRRTDIFEIRDALLAVDRRYGPTHGVVAHSLGALAYLSAARSGLDAGASVLVSPAVRLEALVDTFKRRLGLSRGAADRLGRRVAAFVGDDFYSGLLEHGSPRTLVVHDRDDTEIPWDAGRDLADALPGARLATTAGLGHYRILRERSVVEEAAGFLDQGRTLAVLDEAARFLDRHRPDPTESSRPEPAGSCLRHQDGHED